MTARPVLPLQGVPLDVAYRGTPDAGVAMGLQPGYAPAGRVLMAWYPELYPIPDATEFTINDQASSPGAGTIQPAVFSMELPAGCRGIIRTFSQGIAPLTAVTDVRWCLKVNGGPVAGFDRIRFFPGPAARITATEDCFVYLPIGARIEVAVTNVDGAAYLVGAGYSGWFWPDASGRRWMGEDAP